MWWGGRLFEAGRLLTFSVFSMGAYSRWALIRGWALIRINTVPTLSLQDLKSNTIIYRKIQVKLFCFTWYFATFPQKNLFYLQNLHKNQINIVRRDFWIQN